MKELESLEPRIGRATAPLLAATDEGTSRLCYVIICPVLVLTAITVAFKIYDMDGDGYIGAQELYQTLSLLVGRSIPDAHLEQVRMCGKSREGGSWWRLNFSLL